MLLYGKFQKNATCLPVSPHFENTARQGAIFLLLAPLAKHTAKQSICNIAPTKYVGQIQ